MGFGHFSGELLKKLSDFSGSYSQEKVIQQLAVRTNTVRPLTWQWLYTMRSPEIVLACCRESHSMHLAKAVLEGTQIPRPQNYLRTAKEVLDLILDGEFCSDKRVFAECVLTDASSFCPFSPKDRKAWTAAMEGIIPRCASYLDPQQKIRKVASISGICLTGGMEPLGSDLLDAYEQELKSDQASKVLEIVYRTVAINAPSLFEKGLSWLPEEAKKVCVGQVLGLGTGAQPSILARIPDEELRAGFFEMPRLTFKNPLRRRLLAAIYCHERGVINREELAQTKDLAEKGGISETRLITLADKRLARSELDVTPECVLESGLDLG